MATDHQVPRSFPNTRSNIRVAPRNEDERKFYSFVKTPLRHCRSLKFKIRNKIPPFRTNIAIWALILFVIFYAGHQAFNSTYPALVYGKYEAHERDNPEVSNVTSNDPKDDSHIQSILHNEPDMHEASKDSSAKLPAELTQKFQDSSDAEQLAKLQSQIYEREDTEVAANEITLETNGGMIESKEGALTVDAPNEAKGASDSDELPIEAKGPKLILRDSPVREKESRQSSNKERSFHEANWKAHSPGETIFGSHHRDVTEALEEDPWSHLSGYRTKYKEKRIPSSPEFEALEIWSDELPSSHQPGRITEFCRIFDACRTKNGNVLLPVWMEIHDVQLRQCGVTRPLYVLTEDNRDKYRSNIDEHDGIGYSTLDLLSAQPSRKNRHLFLADSLPSLYYLDAVFGSGRNDPKAFAKHCVTSSDIQAGSCTHSESLRPAMFVRKEAFSTPWAKNYMKLLANPKVVFDGQPLQYLNLYATFSSKANQERKLDGEAVCFRSIFTMPGRYNRISQWSLSQQNPFFKANNVNRTPASVASGSQCTLNIAIFNQPRENSSTEAAELKNTIQTLVGKMPKTQNLSLHITETHIDSETFNKQVHLMQKTNILIAPHGAELSNIIFLKPGSHVIEVMPFSYHAGVFSGMARQFALYHRHHMTRSDDQSFFQCIDRYNDGSNDKLPMAMKRLHKAWADANQEFTQGHRMTSLRLEKPPSQYDAITHLKDCARRQTLWVSTKDLATDVLNSASQLCQRL